MSLAETPSASTAYPAAPRAEQRDELHGHLVADPYRWLEDAADPATLAWSAAQDTLARTHLDALPGRAGLAATLGDLQAAGSISVPIWRAGRAFFSRRAPGQEHAVLHVREPSGQERVLIDPSRLDPTGRTTLDSWTPNHQGTLLVHQLSVGGDEESSLQVLDVGNGEIVDGPIDRCRYSAVSWLPGGTEFFYVRKVSPEEAADGEADFHRRIWRHRVGDPTERDQLVDGPGLYEEHTYYGVRVSLDGRWLVVEGSVGTARRDSIWIAQLGPGEAGASGAGPVLRPVLTQADGVRCGAWVERDGLLYLLTTLGAARFRLCVADPANPEPKHWRELVAEDPDSVLDGVRWLERPDGGEPLLALLGSRHAVSELALHDAETGQRRGAVELPGTGSVIGLTSADPATPEQRGRLWIGWTDQLTPPEVHRFDLGPGGLPGSSGGLPGSSGGLPGSTDGSTGPVRDSAGPEGGSTVLETAAPGAATVPDARTEQVEFRSPDGTTVRMFVISPAGGGGGPRPAVLTGYGGFGLSYEPAYTPSALAWVAAGGVWALASLRGGGEEGEDWHRAGMRESKQNVFDDFHAAGDALVAAGLTTHDQLAIIGGSNGGLLVGAALVQRPAAYRAVVCSAPLLDMVRYELFSLGRTWNDEYGTAADPEELGWLLSYSPYHHVVPGTAYPAVLFSVFDSDSRVDPLHARKMCAALQHATVSDPATHPVLLRREVDVGHGARSVSRAIALGVDQLSFLAACTGLELV